MKIEDENIEKNNKEIENTELENIEKKNTEIENTDSENIEKEKKNKDEEIKNIENVKTDNQIVISSNNLPPFDFVVRFYMNHYLTKLNRHILPESRWKYLVMFTEIVHFLVGFSSFTIGIFFPPEYLPYNILFISFVILGWQLLGYCFVTRIVSKLIDEDHLDSRCEFLVPLSETALKLYGGFILCLSLFFTLKPQWAPFTLLKPIITYILNVLLCFFQTH